MKIVKLLVVLSILGGAYHYWNENSPAEALEASADSEYSDYGFVALPPVAGASANTVLVIAAQNCPHEDAQRADSLAEGIAGNGIQVVRAQDVSFEFASADSSMTERIMNIMNGPLPIVIVNGRAKSNPSLDEVIAEYRASRL
jgi:hypothetical protein